MKELDKENLDALEKGIANLERHVNNIRNHYGLPCVVSINHFTDDTDAEVELLKDKMAHHGAPVILARHWAEGGKGAVDVARAVVRLCETTPTNFKFVYEDSATLWDKMKAIATKIYGAARHHRRLQGARRRSRSCRRRATATTRCAWPRPSTRSRPTRSCAARRRATSINIREVRLAAGAEFVVMVCGDIMTMPGLPKVPSANAIDVDDDGKIVGLF